MKDEIAFFIIKFSEEDWVKEYSIEISRVKEFVEWLWSEVSDNASLEPVEWVESKVIEYLDR